VTRDQLIAAYERLTGERPPWFEALKDEGIAWHLDQVTAQLAQPDPLIAPEQDEALSVCPPGQNDLSPEGHDAVD